LDFACAEALILSFHHIEREGRRANRLYNRRKRDKDAHHVPMPNRTKAALEARKKGLHVWSCKNQAFLSGAVIPES